MKIDKEAVRTHVAMLEEVLATRRSMLAHVATPPLARAVIRSLIVEDEQSLDLARHMLRVNAPEIGLT